MIALRPRPVWFFGGLAASAAAFAWMASVAPGNVVALQFAFTAERAHAVLAPWPWDETTAALRRDMVFLAVYWVPNVVAASWAADRYRADRRVRLATLRYAMVAAALAVSLLDAVENWLSLAIVRDVRDGAQSDDWFVALMSSVAVVKWLCVAVLLAYVLRALVLRVRS